MFFIINNLFLILGKGFSNDENFGQFPLQVNGFRDIHESLEAATAHGAIETVSNDTTQQSGQEVSVLSFKQLYFILPAL